jgi:hypothetical protein
MILIIYYFYYYYVVMMFWWSCMVAAAAKWIPVAELIESKYHRQGLFGSMLRTAYQVPAHRPRPRCRLRLHQPHRHRVVAGSGAVHGGWR